MENLYYGMKGIDFLLKNNTPCFSVLGQETDNENINSLWSAINTKKLYPFQYAIVIESTQQYAVLYWVSKENKPILVGRIRIISKGDGSTWIPDAVIGDKGESKPTILQHYPPDELDVKKTLVYTAGGSHLNVVKTFVIPSPPSELKYTPIYISSQKASPSYNPFGSGRYFSNLGGGSAGVIQTIDDNWVTKVKTVSPSSGYSVSNFYNMGQYKDRNNFIATGSNGIVIKNETLLWQDAGLSHDRVYLKIYGYNYLYDLGAIREDFAIGKETYITTRYSSDLQYTYQTEKNTIRLLKKDSSGVWQSDKVLFAHNKDCFIKRNWDGTTYYGDYQARWYETCSGSIDVKINSSTSQRLFSTWSASWNRDENEVEYTQSSVGLITGRITADDALDYLTGGSISLSLTK